MGNLRIQIVHVAIFSTIFGAYMNILFYDQSEYFIFLKYFIYGFHDFNYWSSSD